MVTVCTTRNQQRLTLRKKRFDRKSTGSAESHQLNKSCLNGRVAGGKQLLTQSQKKSCLQFATRKVEEMSLDENMLHQK